VVWYKGISWIKILITFHKNSFVGVWFLLNIQPRSSIFMVQNDSF